MPSRVATAAIKGASAPIALSCPTGTRSLRPCAISPPTVVTQPCGIQVTTPSVSLALSSSPARTNRRASDYLFFQESFYNLRHHYHYHQHHHHHRQSISMDTTLAKLFSNNDQWVDAVNKADPDFFEKSAQGQSPKVLWLGCSDSRVPESVLTASRPGDIFVHRNIANQIHPDDDSVLSVITYAVEVVGIEHILVVGHTNCGGALACLEAASGKIAPPTTPLARWLAPLTSLARSLDLQGASTPKAMRKLVEENVRVQVANVVNATPVRAAWESGRKNLWVHGLVYDLETGRLNDLGITQGSFTR
ncbi:carbonic anhydrase [Multifurca ochricompacta]|uniref:Carbonic anhydrase n=1 Tax=Multifurca ochricompacta TaxID=376703 RepID=A0AAD4LY70_9AGAM|nr:carbonic anhydrase [Multifurca ochricompacta]